MKILKILIILLLIPSVIFAFFDDKNFVFYKNLSGDNCDNCYFEIDKDIYNHTQRSLNDLRIINKDNQEQAYKIWRSLDNTERKEIEQSVKVISRKEIDNGLEYILDVEDSYNYGSFKVELSNDEFMRAAYEIYGSQLKNTGWQKINRDKYSVVKAGYKNGKKYGDEKIYYNNKYRYIKLILILDEGNFDILGFTQSVYSYKNLKAEKNEFLPKVSQFTEGTKTILKVDIEQSGLGIDKMDLTFEYDRDYNRSYVIYTSDDGNAQKLENYKRRQSNQNYWKRQNSGNIKGNFGGITHQINLSNIKDRFLMIEIENNDNIPLVYKSLKLFAIKDYILLKNLNFNDSSYRVYYGADAVSRPQYDISFLNIKNNLANFNQLSLGDEIKNKNMVEKKKPLSERSPALIYLFMGLLVSGLGYYVYRIFSKTVS